MIRLTCTNCRAVLTMDDAFAGGVCRCQHCGTIQTVPKNSEAAYSGAAKVGGESKPLFQRKHSNGTPAQSGSGLDQLAEAVASSGLGGSGLSSDRMRAKTAGRAAPASGSPDAAAQQRRLMLLLGAGLGVVIVLLAIVIILMMRGNQQPSGGSAANAGKPAAPSGPLAVSHDASPAQAPSDVAAPTPPPAPVMPKAKPGEQTFCGVPLTGPVVIFLLDRGQGSMATFDGMRVACEKSLETLKPQQKFQVIFWNNSAPPAAFPENGPAPAVAKTIAGVHQKFDDIAASGASDVMPALTKALAAKPSTIVLVTGKLVDDDFAASVLGALGGSKAKINTVLLGQSEACDPLRQIAQKTGGQYKEVSEDQLQSFSQ